MSGKPSVASAVGRLRVEAGRVARRVQDARRRRRNADRDFDPIFVAGAIGSGTSLLAATLAQRLAVAGVALESAREVDRRSCLWIDRVHSFSSVRSYEQQLQPRPDWSSERAREDLLELYRSRALDPDRRPFVDKGPNTNLVRAAFLESAFPGSPFVLIFRDPVANVEGFRRKWLTFRNDTLEESVRFWAAVHERFLEVSAPFADRVVTVEYEALVADYEGSIERLSRTLGVPAVERPRPVEARAEGRGRGLRGVASGRIRVLRDANERSYETLEADEIERIRELLTPVHARLRERARASGFALNGQGPA